MALSTLTNTHPLEWHCQPMRDIALSHLHVIGTINTNPLMAQPGEIWFSNTPDHEYLGAETNELASFTREQYTWYNYMDPSPDNETETYTQIIKGISSVRSQTRCALLLNSQQYSTLETCAQKNNDLELRWATINKFPTETITMTRPDTHNRRKMETKPNSEILMLVILQKGDAAAINMNALQQELTTTFPENIPQPPDPTSNKKMSRWLNWDNRDLNTTTSRTRHNQYEYPTLSWYRNYPGTAPTTATECPENHNKILGAMGILPRKRFKAYLLHSGIDESQITETAKKAISATLMDSALKIYANDKAHYYRNLFGTTDPHPPKTQYLVIWNRIL